MNKNTIIGSVLILGFLFFYGNHVSKDQKVVQALETQPIEILVSLSEVQSMGHGSSVYIEQNFKGVPIKIKIVPIHPGHSVMSFWNKNSPEVNILFEEEYTGKYFKETGSNEGILHYEEDELNPPPQ